MTITLQVVHGVHLEEEHVIRKRRADQPLRIYLHYDHSVDDLTSVQRDVLKVPLQTVILLYTCICTSSVDHGLVIGYTLPEKDCSAPVIFV